MSLFYPDYIYKLTLKSADVTLVATRSSVDVAKFDVSVRRGNTTHHAVYTLDIPNIKQHGLLAECEHAKGLSSTCGGIKFTDIVVAISEM